jgi:hypothetical protein
MRETTKTTCRLLRWCTYYVCAQPSPTWLVFPTAETAVLDLVRVASPCSARSTHRGTSWVLPVIDRARPHYLGMINHFRPKVDLVIFTKKPTRYIYVHSSFFHYVLRDDRTILVCKLEFQESNFYNLFLFYSAFSDKLEQNFHFLALSRNYITHHQALTAAAAKIV